MNFEKPLIYLITDGSIDSENYSIKSKKTFELIEAAVNLGVSMIQIREKKLPCKLLFQLATDAVKITLNSSTKILINDRLDVALAADADGVHLTSNSIPVNIIRQNFPKDFLIGVSTHSFEEALQAKNDGANFAVFGPVFPTPNKGEPKGIEGLSEVVNKVSGFPIFALGGISDDNIIEVLRTGCSGIAAIRLLNNLEMLPKVLRLLNGEINE